MKKDIKKPVKLAGKMRNDLMRVRGNKISIQYKRTTISTGYPNTPIGWKMANERWSLKLKELQEIADGTRPLEDSIKNIFNKFLDYKRKITKITKKTEQYYLTGFNAIITEPNLVLSEANRKLCPKYNSIGKFSKYLFACYCWIFELGL